MPECVANLAAPSTIPLQARGRSCQTAPMDANRNTFETRLKNNAREIEALLDALLLPNALSDEIARPETLRSAMHYAVLNLSLIHI